MMRMTSRTRAAMTIEQRDEIARRAMELGAKVGGLEHGGLYRASASTATIRATTEWMQDCAEAYHRALDLYAAQVFSPDELVAIQRQSV
jgi:hypothetical protein